MNELKEALESGEPVVVIVVSQKGLDRAFVMYPDGDPEALEAGNLLLAKISPQLTLIDNALRKETPAAVSAASSVFAVSQKQAQPTRPRTAAVQPVLRGGRPVNLNFGEEENGASTSP